MQPPKPRTSWHIAKWPPLAWIETLVKLVALATAIYTAINVIGHGTFQSPTGSTWVEFIILIILSLGLLAAIYDRLLEREIIAMVFVIVNNLGHWGMTIALLADPKPTNALLRFGVLMLVGDLLKLVFLKTSDFKVRETPPSILYGLTASYIIGYVLLILIELAFQ
jgi:hypothetical protein